MEPLYIEYPDDGWDESERGTIDTRDYHSAYSDRGVEDEECRYRALSTSCRNLYPIAY